MCVKRKRRKGGGGGHPSLFDDVREKKVTFRPGGFFHMGMRSGEGYKMWGKFGYQDIVPPERIVFINSFSNQAGDITRHPIVPTWPRETKVMVMLEEQPGDKTKLSVRWSPHNASEVEQKTFDVSHVGMQATWGGTFDRLAAYLAGA